MAKPRIFISSTYYDLKNIRADLERFIRDQGYEAVMNEKGHIPYGSEKKLEEYCYKEIESCDILVSIIGGRFGSESKEPQYSISNIELKTAIEQGKQVYIFIDRGVYTEFGTYKANKKGDVNYIAVDDKRVYEFIEEVTKLPVNNQTQSFETAYDITRYLKEQWAGLFQRLLSESSRQKEILVIEDLKNTAKTLNQMVNFIIEEREQGDQAIKDILLSNHPAFEDIRNQLQIPYRVFFNNLKELEALLKARQFDEPDIFDEWEIDDMHTYKNRQNAHIFAISKAVFDNDGRLKIFTPDKWQQEYVLYKEPQENPWADFDDEIPF